MRQTLVALVFGFVLLCAPATNGFSAMGAEISSSNVSVVDEELVARVSYASTASDDVPSIICYWCDFYTTGLPQGNQIQTYISYGPECDDLSSMCVLCESASGVWEDECLAEEQDVDLGMVDLEAYNNNICTYFFNACHVSLTIDLELVQELVDNTRSAELISEIRSSSDMYFNAERQSLQALGCYGSVVVNLPLTGANLEAVRRAAVEGAVSTAPSPAAPSSRSK